MKLKIKESGLWFFIGVVSNISIFQIGGNTIFTYCLYLYPLIFAVLGEKIEIRKNNLAIYVGVSFLSAIICLSNSQMQGWYVKTVISFMNILWSYILYCFLIRKEDMMYYFVRGLYCGGIAHFCFWAAQVFTSKIFGVDLNHLLFGISSQFKGNEMVYSGLAIHAGILVPTIVVAILLSDKFYIKVLIMIFGCYTRNTTTLLTICFYCMVVICVEYIPSLFKKMKRIKPKRIIQMILGAFILAIVYSKTQLANVVNNSFDRVFTIINGNFTSGSDATHMRYLTSFPYIVRHTNWINILFGNGIGTSGFVMSKFFHQYTDMIWTIECDWLDIFYSVGAIGWLIIYGNLLYIAIAGYKVSRKYSVYTITIIAAGAFYNFHLQWLIIFEFLLTLCIKKKIDIWNYKEYFIHRKDQISESVISNNDKLRF